MRFQYRSLLPFKISEDILKRDLISNLSKVPNIENLLKESKHKDLSDLIKKISPTIHKIVNELSKNEGVESFLYLLLIAVCLDVNNLEVIIFFYGLSNTGKSTLLRLLSKLIDPNSTKYIQTRDLNSEFGLSSLAYNHTQLLIIPEAEINGMTSATVSKMKNITSSHDEMQVNVKFENLVKMKFKGLLCIASNEPVFDIESEGIINKRLIPIVMSKKFNKQKNVDVLETIPDSEFINFIVAVNTMFANKKEYVAKEIYKFRNHPVLISDYLTILKSQQDLNIVDFLKDCFVEEPSQSVPLYPNENTTQLSAYQAYLSYLRESGETDDDTTKREFKSLLMDYVCHTFQNRVVIKRVRYGEARVLSLVNVRLNSQPPQDPKVAEKPENPVDFVDPEDQKDPSPPSSPSLSAFLKAKKSPSVDKISVSNNQIQVEPSEKSCIGETKATLYNASNPPKLTDYLSLQELDWMALDIETTGLDLLRNHIIFSIQFCIPYNQNSQQVFVIYNVPEILESMQTSNKLGWNKFFKTFWHALQHTRLIGHNLMFDLIGLFKLFQQAPFKYEMASLSNICKPGKILDTYLMAKYLENGLNTSLSLESTANKHLNIDLDKSLSTDLKKYEKSKGYIDWLLLEKEKGFEYLIQYMVSDILYLHLLSEKLTKKMSDRILNCYTVCESQFLPLFVKMSIQGITVDTDEYDLQYSKLEQDSDQQYKLFIEKYIQPNILESWFSASIKKKYLKWCDQQTISLFDFLKQQKITLDSRYLCKGLFASKGLPIHNFNQKELSKVKQDLMEADNAESGMQLNFLKDFENIKNIFGMLKKFKQFKTYSDKLYCWWNAFNTYTGRIVATKMAIQTMDKKIRTMVTAPPNHKLVIADLSTIELRLIAECTKDEKFLEVFKSEDADLHLETAQALFPNKQLSKKSPERMLAKGVNFGIAYGTTMIGLYENLKFGWNIDITKEQTQQYYDRWYQTYPKVKTWGDAQYSSTRRLGYAESSLGRARFWPTYELNKYITPGKFDHVRNSCVNHPIQSSCVDIIYKSLSILKKDPHLFESILLLVHDEIVLTCPDDPQKLEQAKQKLITAMATATKQVFLELNPNSPQSHLPDEVLVEVNIQDNWAK